jgi:hypothetical protein
MATELSSTVTILDIATGPVAIKESTVEEFDIEDFVSLATTEFAEKVKLYQKALRADPEFTSQRTPVIIGGKILGGF